MQNDPEKVLRNFNEYHGNWDANEFVGNTGNTIEQREIISFGSELVQKKIQEVLGEHNKLTSGHRANPQTRFIENAPEHPNAAGYFHAERNEIAIITGKIRDDERHLAKVYIHELFHFYSHNSRDKSERINLANPIAINNNVGLRRYWGLDIRAGREGQTTNDYFLAFNEAVTEQLAAETLPNTHETYHDYRELLGRVIDDAVEAQLGTKDKAGNMQPWSKKQFTNYSYRCFLTGDLDGFTNFLQNVYRKYKISEQQFGLMTHKDDLPSVIEAKWIANNPDGTPPNPTLIKSMVQGRLDNKTADDYVSDVVLSAPENDDTNENTYGKEYDTFIKDHKIVASQFVILNDKNYELDSHNGIIYHGQEASEIFDYIKTELDCLLVELEDEKNNKELVAAHVENLLFNVHYVSMLSDGFRDFYIYKHSKLDALN